MFKRRRPLTLWRKIREAFWPSMGWRRAVRYAKLRLIRLAESTHIIAASLALGTALSFSPLVGTHFIQAAVVCYFVRLNYLAAFIGTFVGNPWTFPFIWWMSYKLGALLFAFFGWSGTASLPDHVTLGILWDIVKTKPMEIFLPWMLGGYLLGFLCWFPAYFFYYSVIKGARMARQQLRRHRMHKTGRHMTKWKIR